MDIADDAAIAEDVFLRMALHKSKKQEDVFSGFCLNCGHVLQVGKFCNLDCSHDWDKRIAAQKRNGEC